MSHVTTVKYLITKSNVESSSDRIIVTMKNHGHTVSTSSWDETNSNVRFGHFLISIKRA